MIRSLATAALLLFSTRATAEDTGDVLRGHQVDFGTLVQRTIGSASQPIGFDWRHTRLQVAGTIGYPLELNSFGTARAGVLFRRPIGGTLLELGIGWVQTWETRSSRGLATTPYRQFGRPSHLNVDVALALPVAEGVVTSRVRALPAAQLTLNVYGGLRYRYYPGAMRWMSAGAALGALFNPSLTETELSAMATDRIGAMQVDTGRYDVMLGIGNDVYVQQGFFVSPRAFIAVPVLAPLSQTELKVWVDLSMHVGWAF